MTESSEAVDLLELARSMCEAPSDALAGRWPRAAAILARAALEESLDDYWTDRASAIADCGAQRPKMLCLPSYVDDPEVAHAAYQVWASLSAACHRHAYELDPTVGELLRWIEAVEEVRSTLRSPV